MHKQNVVSSVVLMALSAWLVFWAIPDYTFGTSSMGLSPRGLPTAMAAGVGIFGLIQLILSLSAMAKGLPSRESEKLGFTHTHWRILGLLAPAVIICMLIMHFAGFIAAGIVFLTVLQYMAGQRKPIPLILVAVITPILLDQAIWHAMGVMLPQGILFN